MRLILVLSILLLSTTANATVVCLDSEVMLKHLSKDYKEEPVWIGSVDEEHGMMVLSSPKGATWTLVMVNSDGTSCGIAAGKNSGLNKETK